MTTFTPESVINITEWFRFINTPQLNLNLVDGNTTLGLIIIEGYKVSPYETVQMIREQAEDNRDLMIRVISNHNAKLIGI